VCGTDWIRVLFSYFFESQLGIFIAVVIDPLPRSGQQSVLALFALHRPERDGITRGLVQYIAVYGELPEPGKNANADQDLADDFGDVLELLSGEYELLATSGEGPVLRLYQRKKVAPAPQRWP
jgi:hypothetical protein